MMLYTELARWTHVFDPPRDYASEAEVFWHALNRGSNREVKTLLELGCGGGGNASHMKRHCCLTLVDKSHEMLKVSQILNPECEHVVGDMLDLRLGRTFDAVFVHDAVMYASALTELQRVVDTCYHHCSPGGCVLLCPDSVAENWHSVVEHGESQSDEVRMCHIKWIERNQLGGQDAHFVVLTKERHGPVFAKYECHKWGLFSIAQWEEVLMKAGFRPVVEGFPGSSQVLLIGGRSALV